MPFAHQIGYRFFFFPLRKYVRSPDHNLQIESWDQQRETGTFPGQEQIYS